MSDLIENAMEVDSLILGDEFNGIAILSGGVLPHVLVPDAPPHSIYYRTNGEVYQVNDLGSSIEANWIDITPNNTGGGLGSIPFCNANGTIDNIPLTLANEIPFFDSNGIQDDIALTS